MHGVSIGMMIDSDQVYLAALRRSMRDIRLAGHMHRSLSPEASPADRLARAEDLLEVFREKTGIRDAEFHIGIPGEGILCREIVLPTAAKENLSGVLGYQMEKIIPMASEDIFYAHEILTEDRAEGVIRVLLGIGRKDVLTPYQDLARRIWGGASGIHVKPAADIMLLAEAGLRDADEWKERAAHLLSSHGGAETLEESPDAAPSSALDPVSALLSSYGLPLDDILPFAPACGLALMGLRPCGPRLNFLPAAWRRRPSRLPLAVLAVLLLLLTLSAVLAVGGWWHHRNRMADLRAGEVNRLAAEALHADKLRRRVEDGTARLKEMAGFGVSGIPALDLLRELTRQIPENAWVTELHITEAMGRITGEAENAADLIGLLEDSPLMKQVVFTSAITRTREGKERFSIRFEPERPDISGQGKDGGHAPDAGNPSPASEENP
ncbi:MAG: hypothetical protein CSB33_03535 [Desulfobacterales bacterium]|nr:MAG: hypothetical protein CSB33_03535 [Desulfobacterales bacterium]